MYIEIKPDKFRLKTEIHNLLQMMFKSWMMWRKWSSVVAKDIDLQFKMVRCVYIKHIQHRWKLTYGVCRMQMELFTPWLMNMDDVKHTHQKQAPDTTAPTRYLCRLYPQHPHYSLRRLWCRHLCPRLQHTSVHSGLQQCHFLQVLPQLQ